MPPPHDRPATDLPPGDDEFGARSGFKWGTPETQGTDSGRAPGGASRAGTGDVEESGRDDELIVYEWTEPRSVFSRSRFAILVDCRRGLLEFHGCHLIRDLTLTHEDRYRCHVDQIRGMAHNPERPQTSYIQLSTEWGEVTIESNGDPAEFLRLRNWLVASVANVQRRLISRSDVWTTCLLLGLVGGVVLSAGAWSMGDAVGLKPLGILFIGALVGLAFGALVAWIAVVSGEIVNLPDPPPTNSGTPDRSAGSDRQALSPQPDSASDRPADPDRA